MAAASRIAGKVALVTGGASGFGRGVANHFVKQGAKVVICDLPESNGDQVAKSLGKDNALFVPTDVTSDPSVRNALESTKSTFKRLDIAINAAAVRGTWNIVGDEPHDLEAFRNIVDVNLNGTFNVVRLASALMNENDPDSDWQKGIFINVASDIPTSEFLGQAALAGAHGGVASLTLLLARDLATIGVRCITVTPTIASIMNDNLKPWETHATNFAKLAENLVENPMINGTLISLDTLSTGKGISSIEQTLSN